MSIFVGTSGWSYKDWAATFYPPGVGPKRQLGYYARHFSTVEINASFYRLPTEEAIATWHAQVPAAFRFAVKGSRAVTHYYKLKPGAKSFALLLTRIAALEDSLGPLLWQLPASLHKDIPRLTAFLRRLPKRFRHAIEFRDESWLSPDVFALLRQHNVANVALSAAWFPQERTITADFTYVRFHGLEGGAAHDYSCNELQPWARFLRRCARTGLDGYAYFNNDVNARAPDNALSLVDMLGRHAVRPARHGESSAGVPAS